MSRHVLPLSVRVGVETLKANPLRTGLSTLGVVMGAASLVAVLSLGDGAESFARRQIEQRGLHVVAIQARTSDTVDGLVVPRHDVPLFTTDDLRELAAAAPSGTEVVLSVEGTGTFEHGGGSRGALVTGILVAGAATADRTLAAGRSFRPAELDAGAPVALIGNTLARELARGAPLERVVGSALALGGQALTVIGVHASIPGERLFAVTVPLALAEAVMVTAHAPRVRSLMLKAPRVEDVLEVKARAEQWTDRRHPDWRPARKVTIASTGLDRLATLNQGILIFKILMGAITAISLVVGGIGIMNVLLASVAERTKEIGVRKAAGARKLDIVVQFLAESVIIAITGALVGAGLGVATAFLVTAVMRSQTEAQVFAAVTWQTILVAVGAAAMVGIVFGMYPAAKAARLSPVEAMRYE